MPDTALICVFSLLLSCAYFAFETASLTHKQFRNMLLISKCLEIFLLFFCYFELTVAREYTLYDLIPLIFLRFVL